MERIERVGVPAFYGYAQYIQEVKKDKKTKNGNQVEILGAVEFLTLPDYCGNKVDIKV